jgi:serine protease SohB
MLACVGDRIVAAPFAVVGSIGVASSRPVLNFQKLFRRWGVEPYTVKSGKKAQAHPLC